MSYQWSKLITEVCRSVQFFIFVKKWSVKIVTTSCKTYKTNERIYAHQLYFYQGKGLLDNGYLDNLNNGFLNKYEKNLMNMFLYL
jgi:hypothetical protein